MMKPSDITAVTYPVAVIMERVKLASPWMPYRWEARGVVRDISPAGTGASVIVRDERQLQIVFPGLELKLVRDEAEGYYLNLTSPEPMIFVLWRLHEDEARPEYVTVSYHEGTRWADSGDNVDGVALPPEMLAWVGEFVEHNYRPQPRKKVRYASNKDGVIKAR